MPFDLIADQALDRELAKLPAGARAAILAALEGLRAHPLEHPKVVRLHGSRYPGSFRMRIGSYRLLGLVLASQSLVFLTTAFHKKRDSDYDQALVRHERRLATQGPPLDEAIRAARRKLS
jgi:mRNA-degrading endonuclease RelE of RelBE toxin-antitoxin system